MSAPPSDIAQIIAQYDARRAPFDYGEGEGLPEADVALSPLCLRIVGDPSKDPRLAPPIRSSFHRKEIAIREELQGLSELCSLHALLISHLRKRSFPDQTPYLFHRLWDEHADHLIEHLDSRWLVSAVTTFGDHGLTPIQRSTGLALTALFGAMKLYESERLYSGLTPRQCFPLDRKTKADLPLDMDSYALVGGGLDVNLVARLWMEADQDAVIAPLAHHLLTLLLSDDRSLLSRLRSMRREKESQRAAKEAAPVVATPKPEKVKPRYKSQSKPGHNPAPVPPEVLPASAETLRWGLVSTIKAPLPQIARFAAHHIDMGAEALHIFLDAPEPETAAFLRRHPKIHVTDCDEAYWAAGDKKRPEAHQLRQAHNATRAYHTVEGLHWLGHIDVDEFLITDRPLNELLFGLDQTAALCRLPPVEALATDDGPPTHFKRTHHHAKVPKATLQDIYPTFGLHLYGGFLSHTSGKIFARTGLAETRLGIHALRYRGQDVTNRARPEGIHLAHFHAPTWDHFRKHLEFRREKGSYRARSERPELGQAELFAFLMEEEGDAGLRAFFDEVCADTPELRARLDAHNMLITHDFDLDAKVKRVFGELPPGLS
jgi:hypothetical protein